MKGRSCGALIFLVLISFLAVAASGAGLLLFYFYNGGKLSAPVTLVIPPKTPLPVIAKTLEGKGVIRFPRLFMATTYIYRSKQTLKAGEYLFTPNISPRQIVDMMIAGKSIIHRFTVPEGYSSKQVLRLLEMEQILIGAVTSPVEEGDVLPETYFYTYGDARQQIINRMRLRMQETVDALWQKRAPDLPFSGVVEAVTLASLVEKETGSEGERAKVAAVFINRLRKGMKLQSDPTVIYAITGGERDLGRLLTRTDLQFNSPYNTYVAPGLPPKPIANPGKAALEAVMHPAQTNALYFVADGKGGHRFAATLEEHNRNVEAYRALIKK